MAKPGPKKGQTSSAKSTKSGAQQGKGKKVQTQPPGMPQGLHDAKNRDCWCGRCSTRAKA